MSTNERVRGVHVHRPIIYGSVARLLSPEERDLAPPDRQYPHCTETLRPLGVHIYAFLVLCWLASLEYAALTSRYPQMDYIRHLRRTETWRDGASIIE